MEQPKEGKDVSKEKKRRIGNVTAFLMIVTAVLFDLAQGLLFFLNPIPVFGTMIDLVVSYFITFVSGAIFLLWFMLCRVSYFDSRSAKRFLIVLTAGIVELTPFIDTLPGISLGVIALIVQVRLEDRSSKKAVQRLSGRKLRPPGINPQTHHP